MMKMVDTLMVLLFPFLDFIPFGLPRYWLFKDKLRIPFRYIVLLMCTVAAVNSAAFYYINLGGYEAAAQWTTLMRYGFMLVNLAFSFLMIKESFPKLMFTYLLLVAWTFFSGFGFFSIVAASNGMEYPKRIFHSTLRPPEVCLLACWGTYPETAGRFSYFKW